MTSPKPLKTAYSLRARPSGDILGSIVSNYHFWKRSGTQDMTILPDLPVLGFQFFEIISTIIDLEAQITDF